MKAKSYRAYLVRREDDRSQVKGPYVHADLALHAWARLQAEGWRLVETASSKADAARYA